MDVITSLGVANDQVIAAVPTFGLQFQLSDATKNTPKSPAVAAPTYITFGQVTIDQNGRKKSGKLKINFAMIDVRPAERRKLDRGTR